MPNTNMSLDYREYNMTIDQLLKVQGDSAYEVAVKDGFEGTEEEWLASLVGPQGEPGPTGKDGDPGPAGENGKDGEVGPQGEPGPAGMDAYEIAKKNGFEGSEEEWLESLIGPQGPQGQDGEPGPAGEDGKTGPAGENGKDGLSAYEIATKNGFEGTEEEWLDSLKAAYDDTDIIRRVAALEAIIGTLNDSLEEVLTGGD